MGVLVEGRLGAARIFGHRRRGDRRAMKPAGAYFDGVEFGVRARAQRDDRHRWNGEHDLVLWLGRRRRGQGGRHRPRATRARATRVTRRGEAVTRARPTRVTKRGEVVT